VVEFVGGFVVLPATLPTIFHALNGLTQNAVGSLYIGIESEIFMEQLI